MVQGLKKIINSLAKGRPADAALLAAGIRPPRPPGPEPEEPLHPSTEPQLIAHTASAGHNGAGPGKLLQAHKAAFFFKLERELEKVSHGTTMLLLLLGPTRIRALFQMAWDDGQC